MSDEKPQSYDQQHGATAQSSPVIEDDIDLEDEAGELIDDGITLNKVYGTLVVNLDTTMRGEIPYIDTLKGHKCGINAREFNFLNPFKREVREKDPSAGEGVVLPAIDKAFECLDALNSSTVTFLGDDSLVEDHLAQLLERVLINVRSALPLAPDAVISAAGNVVMEDVVRVRGWINKCGTTGINAVYNLVICLTVNSEAFHKSSDLNKYVTFVQSRLANTVKQKNSKTPVVLGVLERGCDRALPKVADLEDALLGESGAYKVCGKYDLLANQDTTWVPADEENVDDGLFTNRTAIYMYKELSI